MDTHHRRIRIELGIFLFVLFVLFLITIRTGMFAHSFFSIADFKVAHAVQQLRSPAMTSFMLFMTDLGSWQVILTLEVVLCLILFITHRRSAIPLSFAMIIAGQIFSTVFKTLANRARPVPNLLMMSGNTSFPSGHALVSVIFYGIAAHILLTHITKKWLRIVIHVGALAIAFLIGVSRIYLGVHYFSDVVGGWLLGSVLLVMIVALFEHAESISMHELHGTMQKKITAVCVIALLVAEGCFIYYFYQANPLPVLPQTAQTEIKSVHIG